MSMDTALLKRLRDMIGSDDPSTAGLEGVRSEDVADALQPLVGAIDDDAMRRANMLVDVDGGTIESAAATLRSP